MKLFTLIICIIYFFQLQEKVIIDSSLSFEDAVKGIEIPGKILNNLVLLDVEYYSFDNKLHRGQVVIHKKLEKDIREIFEIIKKEKFPIAKVIPISEYDWDDEKSMLDNNTSAFNYRIIAGSKILSAHAEGRAIDINPLLNPHFKRGKTYPPGAVYNPEAEGTLTRNSVIVKEFIKRGWQWGGNWRSSKDYQHFEKR
jgi:peptidoglycan LD-endopeptidase CwlK